jgi:TonB family protein
MFASTKRLIALLLIVILCSTALAQQSSEANAHFNLAKTYLQLKQYDEAIKEFKQAVRLRPTWPEAYFELGMAYSAIPIRSDGSGDNISAALNAFEQAVQLKPDWPEALTELAKKYSSLLQHDKAIAALKKAIELKPEFAEAHQDLAIMYLYTGRFKDAIDRLEQAIRLTPAQPLPHKLLGLAYLVVDEREKALEQYKLLVPLDTEMAAYLQNAIQSPNKPTFGVTSGKLISVPKPAYPEAARSKHVSGKVTVEIAIDESGNVSSARAISGPVELRGPAEAAALKARFVPTKLSGKPVSVNGVITFNFLPQ